MTFLNREKARRWLWSVCFLLVLALLVMAVVYRRLQAQRPDPIWWQAVSNNLDRESIFITIDTCQGFLHQADCSPGDFSDQSLSLIGRSFATDTHYQQWHRDLIHRMVPSQKQDDLEAFKAARGIEFWGLVFDIQIESESTGYFRSRLVASPSQPNLAADLAEAGFLSDDQLEILQQGWYAYDSPPAGSSNNHWLDWVEATRPFFYGQLESGDRQDFVDQLRRQGVYQFDEEGVSQFPVERSLEPGNPRPSETELWSPQTPAAANGSTDRLYEYQVRVECQHLFEVWPAYLASANPEASSEQDGASRCNGPNSTFSTDRLYDYDLNVRVDIDQARIVAFGRHYQDDFFTRQTLSPPDQLSPWDVDPDDQAPAANFDDQVGQLLPPHD